MFNLSYTGFAQAWRRHAGTAPLAGSGGDAGADPSALQLDNGAFLASLALLSLGIPVAGSRRIDADRLFGRRGIVAFVSGNGPQGGLIGHCDSSNVHALCTAAQHKHPLEVRFWALP